MFASLRTLIPKTAIINFFIPVKRVCDCYTTIPPAYLGINAFFPIRLAFSFCVTVNKKEFTFLLINSKTNYN